MHADDGTEVLSRYGHGALAGLPAITLRRHGSGTARYLSTRLDDASYQRLLLDALGEPARERLPEGVEVIRRRAGDQSWLFVLNHGSIEHRVPATGFDLVNGVGVENEVRVGPGGFAVVREACGYKPSS